MRLKKLTAAPALMIVFLVLLSLKGLAQGGCCCDLSIGASFEGRESMMEYEDCPSIYNIIVPSALDEYLNRTCVEICAIRAGIVTPPEGPPPVSARCGDVGYKPGPTNLQARNIKGEKQIRLIWEVECPVDYFIISRCDGSGCDDFELLTNQVSTTYFVDDSASLLWDKDYTYRVIAHYNLQGDSEAETVVANTGDIECAKQYGAGKFCISSIYYGQFSDYFKAHGYKNTFPGSFVTNFTGAVREQFFDKFNKAFSCGDDNKLSSADDVCSRKGIAGGICVVDEGIADCIAPSDCQGISAGGMFGLYYTAEQCEGTAAEKRFCYLDKSKSVVDKCYPCSLEMSCYDYRSRSACEKDNCGVGDCAWSDIFPSIGVGVCVDRRFSSCHLCTAKPTGGSSEAFNLIFEQCSEEKSIALATPDHPCYWKNWQSLSCDEVTCRTYKRPSECAAPSGGIQLYANNSLMARSSDPCEIGVCQWRPSPFNPDQGECLKNADGDTGLWPDCAFASNQDACELDYIPPETDMVATGALGVYDKLHVNIFDKISRTDPGEYKTGSKLTGYITHFCHYPEGQAECNVHASPINTSVGVLAINYLTLHNTEVIESQTKLTDLAPGYNYIKYYSKDPSNNPGIVKAVRVYACARCVGPQIINSYFENGVERNGKQYVNSLRPVLHADFDVDAEVTTAEINSPQGAFISSASYSSADSRNYTFVTETGLDEGNYVFRINAKDDEGTYMNEEFLLPFTIDLTAGAVNFTVDGMPAAGMTVNKTRANIGIEFAEQLSAIEIRMNGREITGAFTTSNNMKFTAQNLLLDEGTVILSVEAKDLANNNIIESVIFYVNGLPPVIRIREPSYGVSPNFKFDVTIETLNIVNCRFLYDVPVPANFSYTDLEPFGMTDSTLHTIIDFTRIPDGDYNKHKIHVFCIDPLWGPANASFELSVDVSAPEIVSAYADPVVIKEALAESTYSTLFKANTNELTFCKYSDTNDDYEDMDVKFPGFKAEPNIPWPNKREVPKTTHINQVNVSDQNRSYTYYVACEDLAGRVSATKEIDFSVDLGIPFEVADHTPAYTNTTSIVLAIETNKRAYCFYGRENNSISSSFQNDGEYAHTTNLVNLPLGIHTFYVQCFTKYETPKETSEALPVTFAVDNTPPFMMYVNDSGPLPDDPGYSYFTDTLRASWLGDDNETGVTRYYYMVETFYGKEPQINWTATTVSIEWVPVTGLNLVQDTSYRFLVKPENAAGLIGEAMESDGVTFDPRKMPAVCNNTVKDEGETDLDCGGICLPCAEGKACMINADCQSRYCDNITKTCKAPACNDNIKNGDETGVDCGGSCLPCSTGAICLTNADCATGRCQAGMCVEQEPCFNDVLDGTETGVDCGGSCPTRCGNGESCLIPADCASELCINGVCEPKRGEGEACENNTECELGLVCKNGICKIQKKEEGESCASNNECDEGLLCFEGRCALDSDGDGLPDEWELRYGLDPNNPGDAMFDSDNDGISNQDEFSRGTNPSSRDTDTDKWWDGQELGFGTDPTNADSRPSAWLGLVYHPLGYWWLWLLILLVLIVVAALTFFGYRTYGEFKREKEKEKKKAAAPPKKPAVKAAPKAVPLTAEERRMLAAEAKKEREISEKLERVKGIIEKKVAPKKKVTEKEWVDIRKIILPAAREKPEEVEPVFKKLETLKKGKLGVRGREKALKELDKLLGKEVKKAKKEAEKKEELIKKEEEKETPFEKLGKLAKAKKKEKEKRAKEYEKSPLGKLRLIALSKFPEEERRKILEKLTMLRTGKLSAAERKELFEKLKITAGRHKKLEKEPITKRKKGKIKKAGKGE